MVRCNIVEEMASLFATSIQLKKIGCEFDVSLCDLNGKPLKKDGAGVDTLEEDVRIYYFGRADRSFRPTDGFCISNNFGRHSIGIHWNGDQIERLRMDIDDEYFESSVAINLSNEQERKIRSINWDIAIKQNTILKWKEDKLEGVPSSLFSCDVNKLHVLNIDGYPITTSYLNELCWQILPSSNKREIIYNPGDDNGTSLRVSDKIDVTDAIVDMGSTNLCGPAGTNLFQSPISDTIRTVEKSFEIAIPGSMGFVKKMIPEYSEIMHGDGDVPDDFEEGIKKISRYRLPSKKKLKQLIWIPECMRK